MLFLPPRPDDLLFELDEREPRLAFPAEPPLFLPPLERPLDLVALFFPPRPEDRLCELDFEDDFLADLEPPPLLLLEPRPLLLLELELDDRDDLDDPRPPPDVDLRADRALEAPRWIVFFAPPPRLPAAFAASAPTTPPTTVPIGPTALPTTAPATAPAVSRGIDGIWMSSDSLEPRCVFESD